MASYNPGKCCTKGVKHEGEATGIFQKVGSIESYLSYPPSKSTGTVILFLTDVFGHKFVNAHLIADQLAAAGYFVCMPDLFNGDVAPLDAFSGNSDFDINKWFPNHGPDVVQPIVDEVRKALLADFGVTKLGAVGYCFGAKYVVRGLAQGGGFDAGYIAHPSAIESEEIKAIQRPLSIAAAEIDYVFPTEKRHESEVILKEIGVPYQINLYGGTAHGFAVRADLKVQVQKYAKEQAFYQAVTWFEEYLTDRK